MSKYRKGFVTNSSSSSFIVALRKDCTLEDIVQELEKHKESIQSTIENQYDYDGCYCEIEDDDDEDCECTKCDCEENITKVIKSTALRLWETTETALELDDWNVESVNCSNEDDIEDCVLYDINYLMTDKFKFVSGG